MDLTAVLNVMEDAALSAAKELTTLQPQSKRLETRKDFLTDADLKSEEIILGILTKVYPDIPSLSEEKGGEEIQEGLVWVIDPIDGTINFFLQDIHWGISIALVENGKTIAGVVYLPAQKQMYAASRDIPARFRIIAEPENTWTNLSVSQESNLASSQFWLGWGKENHNGEDHKKVYDAIARLDKKSLYPQIRNSATADMMMVASGKVTGYVFTNPESFDIAAAGYIIERAGGTVTDLDGNPWGPFVRSLVASNGVLHQELLDLLRN